MAAVSRSRRTTRQSATIDGLGAKAFATIPAQIVMESDLIDLVRGLLRVDHGHRLSVSEALNHAWLIEVERSQSWGAEERGMMQRTMQKTAQRMTKLRILRRLRRRTKRSLPTRSKLCSHAQCPRSL